MTQTRDLIKKMAEFFTGEEFYEKGKDARLELSPDDVRCMNYLIHKALEQEPCESCISKEAVDILVDELARAISDERCCISRGRSTATIMGDILHLPPVTLQLKEGHWIDTGSGQMCSRCGGTQYGYDSFRRFCASCGAKMREEREMTVKEIIDGLKFTIEMFLLDSSTGEAFTEPRNDMDKTTIDACKGAIELLEQTRWIPMSEKLPEPQEYGDKDYSEWLQITIHIGKDCDVVSKAFYCFSTDKWYTNDESAGNGKVSAWRPLLEPYRLRGNIDTIQARIDKLEGEQDEKQFNTDYKNL